MSNNDWLTACMAKAKEGRPEVPSTLTDKLEKLLRGRLSERELPKGELASIAKELIGGIGPVRKEAEPKA